MGKLLILYFLGCASLACIIKFAPIDQSVAGILLVIVFGLGNVITIATIKLLEFKLLRYAKGRYPDILVASELSKVSTWPLRKSPFDTLLDAIVQKKSHSDPYLINLAIKLKRACYCLLLCWWPFPVWFSLLYFSINFLIKQIR